jgi:hypothetical protein
MNLEVLMSVIEVFDPPMCCSTGVCGPSVDPALATFAGDLSALAERGVSVARHNLSQEPKAFAEDSVIRELLRERGDGVLPVVKVNGEIVSSGRYPTRNELDAWTSASKFSELDATTTELGASSSAERSDAPATCCSPAPASDALDDTASSSPCCGGSASDGRLAVSVLAEGSACGG